MSDRGGGNETPGIGGVPGLSSGPAFKAWRRMLTSIGVTAPAHLQRARRSRQQIATLGRRRK